MFLQEASYEDEGRIREMGQRLQIGNERGRDKESQVLQDR